MMIYYVVNQYSEGDGGCFSEQQDLFGCSSAGFGRTMLGFPAGDSACSWGSRRAKYRITWICMITKKTSQKQKGRHNDIVWFQKLSIPTLRKVIRNTEGRGVQEPIFPWRKVWGLVGFPEGGLGGQPKESSVGRGEDYFPLDQTASRILSHIWRLKFKMSCSLGTWLLRDVKTKACPLELKRHSYLKLTFLLSSEGH